MPTKVATLYTMLQQFPLPRVEPEIKIIVHCPANSPLLGKVELT
jgi:hypothetical protein